MDTHGPQDRRDRLVMAAMMALCAVLLALQFRWAGELSRAELTALRIGLRTQTNRASEAFNSELRRLCLALVPSARELDALGFEPAHAARVSRWLAQESRQPFRRVAVVVPEAGALATYDLDPRDGTLERIEWPAAWAALQEQITRRWQEQGAPPSTPADSLLWEAPVLDQGREREWMIFELDDAYLKGTWLPESLSAAFPRDETNRTVGIALQSQATADAPPVTWPPSFAPPSRPPDASGLLMPFALVGPGNGPPRGFRWTMRVWSDAGPLEAIVATARLRNLALAALLIGLIAATAWARIQTAAMARRLAARELAFVASVSHELRTPLTAIRGAGHNLRAGLAGDADKQRAYGALIVERTDELTAMVEQLLALGSLRRTSQPLALARANVVDIIREAVRSTSEAAVAARVTLAVDEGPGLLPVLGDASSLRRVFENLIANALTHGASGGWVGVTERVVPRPTGTTIEVTVADRGPGVSAEERSRIWQPFVRGDKSGLGPHRGFGLGLSIVRETVERHGGTVSVESGDGRGTRFVVHLPSAPEV
jgi:signal transduction histidine kinase